VRAFDILD